MEGNKVEFQLKNMKVSEGDIVIVRLPRAEVDMKLRQNLLNHLRTFFPSNQLLMVGSQIDLSVLPRKTLNAMGWYKKGEPERHEADGFTNIEDELEKLEIKNYVKEKTQLFAVKLSELLVKNVPDKKLDVRVETFIRRRQ